MSNVHVTYFAVDNLIKPTKTFYINPSSKRFFMILQRYFIPIQEIDALI